MPTLNPYYEITPILRNKLAFNLLNTTLNDDFYGIIVKNNLVSVVFKYNFKYIEFALRFEYDMDSKIIFIILENISATTLKFLAIYTKWLDESPHTGTEKYDKKTTSFIFNKYAKFRDWSELPQFSKYYRIIYPIIYKKIAILLDPITIQLFKTIF